MDLNFAVFCLAVIAIVALILNKDHIAAQALQIIGEQWNTVLKLFKRKP